MGVDRRRALAAGLGSPPRPQRYAVRAGKHTESSASSAAPLTMALGPCPTIVSPPHDERAPPPRSPPACQPGCQDALFTAAHRLICLVGECDGHTGCLSGSSSICTHSRR